MATEVRMPKLGLSESEIVLVEWRKNPGEPIAEGDVIAVVEGDKLANDIEAQAGGVLGEHLIAEGDGVAEGALLTTIVTA